MRRFLSSSCLLVAVAILLTICAPKALSQTQNSGAALTDADIVSMSKAGLGADVIVAKIKSSRCDFDTSPTALEQLKSAGVAESVILTVVKCRPAESGPAHTNQAAPKPVATSASPAKIVFFRSRHYVGSALKPSIYLDGRQVARLQNGRYFSMTVLPGKHEISSSMKHTAPLDVDVKPGGSVYVQMLILPGTWRGGGRLVPIPADDGRAAIERLKPDDAKWIVSPPAQPPTQEPAAQQPPAPLDRRSAVEEYGGPTLVTALSYRIIPYSNTTYLTTPGYSSTSCYGGGIDTGYWSSVNVNCQTVTRPPTVAPLTIRWITVYNAVESSGEVYIVTCTAHWIGSACSSLIPGDDFASRVKGNTMWVFGRKGGNRGRKLRVKFRILDVRPAL